MSLADRAYEILNRKGVPLHCEVLMECILEHYSEEFRARNWHSVNKEINTEIREQGRAARFYKEEPGYVVQLAKWSN